MTVIVWDPKAVGVYVTAQLLSVVDPTTGVTAHEIRPRVPVLLWVHVIDPVGMVGVLPVTVSLIVAVHVTVWVRTGFVGMHTTLVVVGSRVTVIMVANVV